MSTEVGARDGMSNNDTDHLCRALSDRRSDVQPERLLLVQE